MFLEDPMENAFASQTMACGQNSTIATGKRLVLNSNANQILFMQKIILYEMRNILFIMCMLLQINKE